MLLSPRQIHLDFHTSELIPQVGARFDAADFARMASEAAVSSMTVFARCHHGWLYYPSEHFPDLVHPQLAAKNLLPDQVRALHDAGIRAPIYITVQWDYHSANTHPEWLIRKKDGAHESGPFTQPGFYQSLCVNTAYRQFLKDMTAEVCQLLGDELDGIFFDIVGIRPCWCSACLSGMHGAGLDVDDDGVVRQYAKQVMDTFKEEMTQWVRRFSPDCTIFYNAGHVGPCTRASAAAYTHFELESLPSGGWGYLHFPVSARYARKLGADCLGMTGKFHTSWGDFHSLKSLAALEFECFRMLSFGFASSIGDQLEPDGSLNPATYRLIGQVYRQFAERESWARPSRPLVEAAVLTPENQWFEHAIPDSVLGAAQLLDELALQYDIIDETMDFSPYPLLILPDDACLSASAQAHLEDYVAAGGSVLACMNGGMDAGKNYPACFAAGNPGLQTDYPDFIIADGPLAAGLEPGQPYAIYLQGNRLVTSGAEVLLSAQAPYFPRSGNRFCSHRYTPSAKGELYPVAVQNGKVILFGHPLFGQYRQNAPQWCKQLIGNAIGRLLPQRLVRHDGPSTVTVQLLDQPEHSRFTLHVLSYIPVRKSATIDIIEERTAVRDLQVALNLPLPATRARLVPDDIALAWDGHSLQIPLVDGYAIIELDYAPAGQPVDL